MQRTFLSNLSILVVINLLIKPIWVLVIDVKVQNTLGPEVYGQYFSLLNFAFLFSVILDFGLNNFNNRRVSRNPESANGSVIPLLFLKTLLAMGFYLAIYGSSFLLGYTQGDRWFLGIICLMLFLQSTLVFLRTNLSGIQWYLADALVSALDKLLMIIIVGAMLTGFFIGEFFSLEHFIYGQIAAYVLAILIVILLLNKRISVFKFSVNWREMLGYFKGSLPFALLTFLMLIYYKIDAVMIERMRPQGDLEAGYYAQAYKLLDATVMFALLFSSLLLPMFSNMLASNQKVENLVKLSTKLLLILASVGVLALVLNGAELLQFLFSEGAEFSSEVFPVLIITLIPLSAGYIYGTLITAEGNLSFLNKLSVVAIFMNVVMNYMFIPTYGILGAGITTLVTQSLVIAVQWFYTCRNYHLSVSRKSIFRFSLWILSMILVGFLNTQLKMEWSLSMLMIVSLGITSAVLVGLLSWKDLRSILRSE